MKTDYQEVKNPYDQWTDGIRWMAWNEGFKAQEPNLAETSDFFYRAKAVQDAEIQRLTKEVEELRVTHIKLSDHNIEYALENTRLRELLEEWRKWHMPPKALKDKIDNALNHKP